SSSPCQIGHAVIVGLLGRIAPPAVHADTLGRKPRPSTPHDHGSCPDRRGRRRVPPVGGGGGPAGGAGGAPGVGDDPVFVLCAGRSGSTLVRFLLDAHQDLACPPETRLPWLARQLATAWTVIEDAGPPGGARNGDPARAR